MTPGRDVQISAPSISCRLLFFNSHSTTGSAESGGVHAQHRSWNLLLEARLRLPLLAGASRTLQRCNRSGLEPSHWCSTRAPLVWSAAASYRAGSSASTYGKPSSVRRRTSMREQVGFGAWARRHWSTRAVMPRRCSRQLPTARAQGYDQLATRRTQSNLGAALVTPTTWVHSEAAVCWEHKLLCQTLGLAE